MLVAPPWSPYAFEVKSETELFSYSDRAGLVLLFKHDLVRKPDFIPDQVRDRLFGIMP